MERVETRDSVTVQAVKQSAPGKPAACNSGLFSVNNGCVTVEWATWVSGQLDMLRSQPQYLGEVHQKQTVLGGTNLPIRSNGTV